MGGCDLRSRYTRFGPTPFVSVAIGPLNLVGTDADLCTGNAGLSSMCDMPICSGTIQNRISITAYARTALTNSLHCWDSAPPGSPTPKSCAGPAVGRPTSRGRQTVLAMTCPWCQTACARRTRSRGRPRSQWSGGRPLAAGQTCAPYYGADARGLVRVA